MPPAHTLHHPTDRTGTARPAGRQPATRPARPAAPAPAARPALPALTPVRAAAGSPRPRRAARALPPGLPGAQRALARSAAAELARAGLLASVGGYGGHATADALMPLGSLVLVPMAALWDLDPDVALEDGSDPAVWHVLARDAGGRLLEPGLGADACPSVLLSARAGLHPGAAPALVRAALADPAVALLLAGPPPTSAPPAPLPAGLLAPSAAGRRR